MLNKATIDFINEHRHDDVRLSALCGKPGGDVDMAAALEQIAGWQTARVKLPSWAETAGIVYPPRLAMEQCSGERAANYKRTVVERLTDASDELGGRGELIDLTGGFGVDFAVLAPLFSRSVYVERQELLCRIARHNMPLLGLPDARIECADAADYLPVSARASMIFIDPSRRDADGRRTYALADCRPDVLKMMPMLTEKADYIMLKLSPMLDISKTVADLNDAGRADIVSEVHVVATGNECKELLILLRSGGAEPATVYCVNDDERFVYSLQEQVVTAPAVDGDIIAHSGELCGGMFLYEPNAAVMKAGCFKPVCRRWGMRMMSVNSHLFLSEKPAKDFPGREFSVCSVSSMNKRSLQSALHGVSRANIATRNFPLSAEKLRKRLRLADGGETYIFATTDSAGKHVIIITRKTDV